MTSDAKSIIDGLDRVVDEFCKRTRYFHEPMTPGRARTFVQQHRHNTRQRNSVLKLRVASNCTDWDTRIGIIGACAQEVIADHEHGGGRPHWAILEGLGAHIGMSVGEIRSAPLIQSTEIAWAAWAGLMSNTHWLEGIVANTCAERINVPGLYGDGPMRKHGWFGMERARWGKLFGLADEQLEFFELHEAADIEHSNLGWNAVARFAAEYGMGDAVVKACRVNLAVWELYLNGIGAEGDRVGAAS